MRRSFLLPLLLLTACTLPEAHDPWLVRPSAELVSIRLDEARTRLNATEGGRRIWQSLDAHGGLGRWYANGPLAFTYRYERAGGSALVTHQTVDPWGARAIHTLADDTTQSFGWTGREAWAMPPGAEMPVNPRFWALTPYYFVGMPFVLADPGVQHALEGTWTYDGKTYDLVRITFAPGTGDAPDDYYVVLLDPATDRVAGVRYVVSYPGFFPEGGHTPETLMWYDGAQTVDGVTLQQGFRSFAWTGEGPGAARAAGSVTNVRFVPDLTEDDFALPDSAAIVAGYGDR